jgi:hypothetical protein
MPAWTAYPSGFTSGINSLPNTFIDPVETIGSTADARATNINAENSAISLMKGILDGVGLPAGSGAGMTNTSAGVFPDLEVTLGLMSDAATTDPSEPTSAISMLKGILNVMGI